MKTLLVSVSLFLAIAPGLNARTVRLPEKDPVFSFTLPDDWTTKPTNDGLECQAGGGSKFMFLIRPFEAATDEEARKGLSELVPTVKNPDMKDFKVGDVEEMAMGKMRVFVLKATMMVSGTPLLLTTIAFAPKKGTYFGTMSMVREDVDAAHRKVMREILSSITPISGGN